MMHLTMAGKSLLLGDIAASTLVEYAALLAQVRSGDEVAIRGIGVDGEEVAVHVLLNQGTVLLTESTTSALPEPENSDAVAYMRERIDSYRPTAPDLAFPGEDNEDEE